MRKLARATAKRTGKRRPKASSRRRRRRRPLEKIQPQDSPQTPFLLRESTGPAAPPSERLRRSSGRLRRSQPARTRAFGARASSLRGQEQNHCWQIPLALRTQGAHKPTISQSAQWAAQTCTCVRQNASGGGPAVMTRVRQACRALCKACGWCETRGVHAAQRTSRTPSRLPPHWAHTPARGHPPLTT